mmetsp:Transcript_42495/g.97376  ORF Transcript_42495/g.97376 Transcript_42495/m.97376 type:complete len:235 (+) Transcript_42495:679-1383(+)
MDAQLDGLLLWNELSHSVRICYELAQPCTRAWLFPVTALRVRCCKNINHTASARCSHFIIFLFYRHFFGAFLLLFLLLYFSSAFALSYSLSSGCRLARFDRPIRFLIETLQEGVDVCSPVCYPVRTFQCLREELTCLFNTASLSQRIKQQYRLIIHMPGLHICRCEEARNVSLVRLVAKPPCKSGEGFSNSNVLLRPIFLAVTFLGLVGATLSTHRSPVAVLKFASSLTLPSQN